MKIAFVWFYPFFEKNKQNKKKNSKKTQKRIAVIDFIDEIFRRLVHSKACELCRESCCGREVKRSNVLYAIRFFFYWCSRLQRNTPSSRFDSATFTAVFCPQARRPLVPSWYCGRTPWQTPWLPAVVRHLHAYRGVSEQAPVGVCQQCLSHSSEDGSFSCVCQLVCSVFFSCASGFLHFDSAAQTAQWSNSF